MSIDKKEFDDFENKIALKRYLAKQQAETAAARRSGITIESMKNDKNKDWLTVNLNEDDDLINFHRICEIMDAIATGGVPTFITNNLREIARYCKINITKGMTARELIFLIHQATGII